MGKKKAVIKRVHSAFPVVEGSAFARQFTQYVPTEFSATLPRPILKNATVQYVLRQDGFCYPSEEQYATDWQATIEVEILSDANQVEQCHESTWKYIVDNAEAVEKHLRSAVWTECERNYREFREELEDTLQHPDTEPHECDWESIKHIDWTHPDSLDRQVHLREISIYHRENLDCAAFTFDIGWDDEHGLCVIMHHEKVLAVNGAGDLAF